MMHLGDALQKLTDYFERHGIDNPRTDAECLMAFTLRCKRLDLFLNLQRLLTDDQLNQLRYYSGRRAKREPLQYILGTVNFFGYSLQVDARVLIPRPETEELLYQLRQYFKDNNRLPQRILDCGTGSGALAIVLATFFPQAQVVALDRSQPALEVARKNVQVNGVQDRVAFIASNWFENVEGSFDCIVANPPYLSEADWDCAQPEVKQFEPRQALVASDNGLSDLKQIIQGGYDHLNSDGVMVMETGLDQHHALEACARSCGYKKMQSTLDLSHRQRYFWLWTNA